MASIEADSLVSSCQFQVTAQKTVFDSGPVAGQVGYKIVSDPFIPLHSHQAPYVPLDLNAENARRQGLSPTDPSLETPPGLVLVRKQQQNGNGDTLATFLPTIDPRLGSEDVLRHFDTYGIPRDTGTDEFLSLGDGVYDLVACVPGLDLVVPALSENPGAFHSS